VKVTDDGGAANTDRRSPADRTSASDAVPARTVTGNPPGRADPNTLRAAPAADWSTGTTADPPAGHAVPVRTYAGIGGGVGRWIATGVTGTEVPPRLGGGGVGHNTPGSANTG
jgi:hypothetical protein